MVGMASRKTSLKYRIVSQVVGPFQGFPSSVFCKQHWGHYTLSSFPVKSNYFSTLTYRVLTFIIQS